MPTDSRLPKHLNGNLLLRMVLIAVIAFTGVTGCSTPTPHKRPPQPVTLESGDPTARQLIAHFREWEGTPYRMGGQSKQGIDCSGYIQLAYREVLNKSVPRTTELLSQTGEKISDQERTVGDLLVFKTGFKQKHVGIYIGNGQFLHASSSRGVMASRLDNPYWSDSYRQTRRLPD